MYTRSAFILPIKTSSMLIFLFRTEGGMLPKTLESFHSASYIPIAYLFKVNRPTF